MKVIFEVSAWQEYLDWQERDRKIARKIGLLLKDISRNGVDKGLGKPEALKYGLSGYWSRRITDEHRWFMLFGREILWF